MTILITKAEKRAASVETLKTGVQILTVNEDEGDMRLDRFLTARFPQLPNILIQKMSRKGELKINGKKSDPATRIAVGDAIRVPPLHVEAQAPKGRMNADDLQALREMTIYEDPDVLILNKPAGLAVQGGSGLTKHIDGMLSAMMDEHGEKPRLVHRIDRDTSGCLIVAKTRFAARELTKTFRTRSARKIYWAVVAGVPKPKQGRISSWIAKEQSEQDSKMVRSKHGAEGASHALTYYASVDSMPGKLTWVSLKPVTGRTHQLRVHMAEITHPIIGDPKYFNKENWQLPGGIQNKLHLHARRIVIPHPRGKGTIDVSSPLPEHMQQTFNLVGWDVKQYDPITESPEE
jgi:23S rRNA pseudouridine955/2504/2580 synthase